MRKIKFLLAALFALIGMSAFAALPEAGQKGFLYNLGSGQYITADATLGATAVEFTIEIKEKDASATPSVEGAKFMRFKTADANYLTFYQEPAAMSTYYGQLIVKSTEKGLLITHPYPNDQGPSWITAGSYLQVVDGALACTALDEANEGAYWFFGTEEELADFIKQQGEEETDDQALLNAAVKAAYEAAFANYQANPNEETEAALLKAKKAATSSIIAYKGIRSSIEMHKQLLAGDEDALEDFEEGVADIVAALNAGTLEGNGIAEMAEIAGIYAELATTAEEEVTMFTYGTECETDQDYIPGGDHGITIDWDAIAEELGTTKDALKIYAMMPDGSLDESYGRGSAGTDGWRDAEGNWASWNSADNLFYVQLTGLNLDGVGCMRTAEPTQYTALFKVVNAAAPEGKYVVLTITLNVKEKEIDTTAPTNVSELAVASTLKDVVTLKIGDNYTAGDGSSANVAAILAALGEESLDNVKIFAVQSDGSLDADYKLGTTDGWRNADGDWAGWGDATSQFYVKADFARATAQLYEVGCHPLHEGVHMTDVINYTAKYAFVVGNKTENKAVIYNVVVAVAPERTDLDVTGETVQYFYNVEAKGFLLGANDWQTRASIGSKGFDMHFEANGDTYKLCAINNTGEGRPGNDLDCSAPGEIWVDGAGRGGAGMWTFTVNADKTFTIANNNVPGLLSVVGDNPRLFMSEDPAAMSTWIAVSAETYSAFANKAQLAEEAATLADIKDLIDGTNIYTQEAYDTYYQMYADAIAKNAAGEVVGNLDNPYTVHGWHAGNIYDDFLLSAWTYNDTQASEFNTALYINTWSTEADGKENASPMHVPFFEYWTGDDNSLGEATLTGTVSDLEAGNYVVSAIARVRIKNNGGDTAYGITFSANESEPVDVCDGRTCSDGDQFRWGMFSTTAVVGADGILKVNFNIAADNNISWLSFKDVKYSKQQGMTPIIITQDATAINEVEATAAAKTVYNMAGQQMKGLQKGLNIVGGKKVLVK